MIPPPACLLLGCLLLLSTHSQTHARAGGGRGGLSVDADNLDAVIKELAKTIVDSQVLFSGLCCIDHKFVEGKCWSSCSNYIMHLPMTCPTAHAGEGGDRLGIYLLVEA